MDLFTEIIRTQSDNPVSGIMQGKGSDEIVSGVLSLEYFRREKTRQKARLVSGESVGIRLPRGTVMRGGDFLRTDTNRFILIEAAGERVSTIHSPEPEVLARIAWHLGNRHVWVQVGSGWLRYLADHVLDDMVRGLGCDPRTEVAPFEPEGGAYHAHD